MSAFTSPTTTPKNSLTMTKHNPIQNIRQTLGLSPIIAAKPVSTPASGHRLHLLTAIADAEAAGFKGFAEALKAQYAEEFAQ